MSYMRLRMPESPHRCEFYRSCVYREPWTNVCDMPRINRGNGDSACHRITPARVLPYLTPVAAECEQKRTIEPKATEQDKKK